MNDLKLHSLNTPQQEAVLHTEGPVLILAGAGSGKTRVITSRIAHLIDNGVAPWHILAVTFTNKASEEMQKRVEDITGSRGRGVVMSTFHRFSAQLLRREGETIGLSPHFVIYDGSDQKQLVKDCLTELNLDEKKFKTGVIVGLISRSKDELIDAASYQIHALASPDPFRQVVAGIYHLYQKKLTQSNALDFGDLIMKAVEILREKQEVRERYQNRFRYIMVDEYQDTNRAQYLMTKILAAKHRNLCVVGDDDQCLPGDTLIQTPQGLRRIESLKEGDLVVSAAGKGRTVHAKIERAHRRPYEGAMYRVTTRKGLVLRATPEHMVFARLSLTKGKHYVYLMYRKDKGFRIGLAKSIRSPRKNQWRTGLAQRGNQEKADKMWILRVCETRGEAQYYESLYAFKYGIPTTVFDSGARKLLLTQQQINQLYSQLDTPDRAKLLMKELSLSFHYPHFRPKGISGTKTDDRQIVHFRMFGDARFSAVHPWGLHRVAINTTDQGLRDRLESEQLHTRPGRRNTWRIETSRLHYEQGMALAEQIRQAAGQPDIHFSAFLTKNGKHDFHPVSHLREGMSVAVFDGKSIVEDEVEKVEVEKYSGDVYDLDIENVHNYIANRWAVHNCVYVWRGADIRNILEFEKEYPEAKVIKLEQNYRSSKAILDAAWNVVKNNQNRKDKKLWTEQSAGDPVTVTEFADEREEALAVVSAIYNRVRHEDFRYADFAVFYRINAQSRVLEDALRRLEVPYKIIGAVRFYDRAEVKDVMAYLRVIVNPKDTLSLKRIINVPSRALGKTSVDTMEQWANQQNLALFDALFRVAEIPDLSPRAKNAALEFHTLISTLMGQLSTMPAVELTRQVLDATGYLKVLEAENDTESQARVQNIKEFLNAVAEYEERSEDKSISGFLEQISLVADSDQIETGPNYVTLMTVHLAKGLEFPCVFLTGLEEGLFPIGESDFSQEELEEERRLCYVGMTRAKKLLHLTWSSSRKLFGKSRWNSPSRFIEESGIVMDRPTPRPAPQASPSYSYRPSLSTSHGHSVSPAPQIDSSDANDSAILFAVGTRVRHVDFGAGKIIEKSGSGDALKVMVLFDSGQWKKLLVKYAGLERV